MMRVERKQLGDGERIWLDRMGEPIEVGEHAWQKRDKRIALSRRQQAMLAAAGQDGPESRWYVLEVEPGAGIAVDKLLEDARIEHWMARQTIVVRRRGRFGMMRPTPKTVPFLPGYLFVRVVWCAPCWHALQGLKGVVSVLGGAERPAPVPDDKMLKLRADVEHDPEAIKAMIRAIHVGDEVSIDDGPFASLPGKVEAVGDNGRVRVEVWIFGRVVSADLELAQVSKK